MLEHKNHNVIMISIDNLRFDCVGYQEHKQELDYHNVVKYLSTPTIDSFAQKSLCFTHCFSTSTYTTAAHASILTGLNQPHHDVKAFYDTKLDSRVITLAEVLRMSGYKTILYTDVMDLFVPLDLHRGFELILSRDDNYLFSILNSMKGSKVFLFAHFFDVHEPFLHNTNDYIPGSNDDFNINMEKLYNEYGLMEEYNKDDCAKVWNRIMRGPLSHRPIDVLLPLYIKGISKFDRGRLHNFIKNLDDIGITKDAVMSVFSDHGEGRYSAENKDYLSHGGLLYDNVLRVPLMISHPSIVPGINDSLMSNVDIFPTILALLGLKCDQLIDGMNILEQNRSMAYAETWFSSGAAIYATTEGKIVPDSTQWPDFYLKQMAVRTGNRKYVIQYNHNKLAKLNHFNKETLLSVENMTLPDAKYIDKLYNEILCREPDLEGMKYYVHLLESNNLTKAQLVDAFINSDEYRSNVKYYVYDIGIDPEEDNPEDYTSQPELLPYFQNILSHHDHEVTTQKIFSSDAKERPLSSDVRVNINDEINLSTFDEKEAKARETIGRAIGLYGVKNIAVAWTGGKDSTTVLHLIRQIFNGRIPFKIINIDTTVKFPEIYTFREKLTKDWDLDLFIVKNKEVAELLKTSKDHAECCYQLKTIPLNQSIESLKIKALITGVRWDEQAARSEEIYFSHRESPEHVRVQPILHFTEADIWEYIRRYNVPYCELYDRGYRSLGCAPCTSPSTKDGPERSGRSRDKEEIMSRLRALGYF